MTRGVSSTAAAWQIPLNINWQIPLNRTAPLVANYREQRHRKRKWHDSAHASLCLLGWYLRHIGFLVKLEEGVTIGQKILKYSSAQKIVMLFAALLAGAKAVCHTGLTVRVDRALQAAFGLPGCAEQSVIANTLDAATSQDVAALREMVAAQFRRHSQTKRHDLTRAILILDLDLSPLRVPACGWCKRCEGAERGYFGRCRSKTGRKLVRVRAAAYDELVWEDVVGGKTAETLSVLQAAVKASERLLDREGEGEEAQAKRARVEWRLDSGWGSEEMLNWLLERGYQVTAKFKSPSRVKKLVRDITAWQPTSSPGREAAPVPTPVTLAKPTQQYAVRTPSKDYADGFYYAVLVSTRDDLPMAATVDHYDGRAGIEAEIKADKHGLALATVRKHKLAAQTLVILLMELAHNVLVWSRRWLAPHAPHLAACGIVRLIHEVWAIPGRVKLVDGEPLHFRLKREHPRARDLLVGFRPLLLPSQSLAFLG